MGALPPGASFAGRDLAEPLPPGSLYTCLECHLWFRHPVPPANLLDGLYRAGSPDAWASTAGHRRDWQLAQAWLAGAGAGGSILDVGCFDGGFLDVLPDSWRRFGIELNPEAAATARRRGIEILGCDVSDLDGLSHRFDVVVAFDLLEHVRDPRRLLGLMARVARPGGLVMVGTGNTAAPTWRLMGSRYWYCAIPEHLSFINPPWCRQVGPEVGLELLDLRRYSHAQVRGVVPAARALAANLLYRVLPGVFQALRARGVGGIDTAEHPSRAAIPPQWMTAKDHLLAVFRSP